METKALEYNHADCMDALILQHSGGTLLTRIQNGGVDVLHEIAIQVALFLRENDENYGGCWPLNANGEKWPATEVFGRNRKRPLIEARAMAWKAMKVVYPKISYKRLGMVFGRDHATVINSGHNHENWCEFDPTYRRAWSDVRHMLGLD